MQNYVSRSGGDGFHVLGKSLWLFQTGQKQCDPLHQLKLVLRNSPYFCERYLLIHYYCLSTLVGIEMSIPGFLDLLRYFDCVLVASSIVIQCSALPCGPYSSVWSFSLDIALGFTVDLLRMQIKLPSLVLSKRATFWDCSWHVDIGFCGPAVAGPHHCPLNGAWLLMASLFSRWNLLLIVNVMQWLSD